MVQKICCTVFIDICVGINSNLRLVNVAITVNLGSDVLSIINSDVVICRRYSLTTITLFSKIRVAILGTNILVSNYINFLIIVDSLVSIRYVIVTFSTKVRDINQRHSSLSGLTPHNVTLLQVTTTNSIVYFLWQLLKRNLQVVHVWFTYITSVPIVGSNLTSKSTLLARHHVVHPTHCSTDGGIHTRRVVFTTPNTPGYNACLDIGVRLVFRGTHQWTSTITLARVLIINTTSTEERVMQLELLTQLGQPKFVLTLIVFDHREVNLLENNLIFSSRSKLVLSPASSKTGLSIKYLINLRKTNCVNVTSQDKSSCVKRRA